MAMNEHQKVNLTKNSAENPHLISNSGTYNKDENVDYSYYHQNKKPYKEYINNSTSGSSRSSGATPKITMKEDKEVEEDLPNQSYSIDDINNPQSQKSTSPISFAQDTH